MAFHLFKKKNYADVIFEGGTVYTLDPEYPKASALAVKNGKVLLSGEMEDMAGLSGPDTQHIDLKGAFAVPGLIDHCGSPVRASLDGFFLQLSESMETEEVLAAVESYFSENPDAQFCLAIEVKPDLLLAETPEKVKEASGEEDSDAESGRTEKTESTEENVSDTGTESEMSETATEPQETEIIGIKELLSVRFPDKAVILASANGYSLLLNHCAEVQVKDRAEELEVQTITPEFVINTLVSCDYSVTASHMFSRALENAEKGITSVYSSEKYSFLENIYRDALIEAYGADLLKQRYFGSYLVDRRLNPAAALFSSERKRTICQELGGLVNFNTIEILFSSDENSPEYMPLNYLKNMGESAADKGFHVRYLPQDHQAALQAFEVAGNLSASYHKLSFTVAHGQTLTEEEMGTVYTGDVHEINASAGDGEKNGENILQDRTENAALQLGIIGYAGTLEEGKWADLAVFEKDPMENLLQDALMTVIAGKRVYEKDKDSAESWADALSAAIASNTEEIFAQEEEA